MSLVSDLAAARDTLVGDAARLHALTDRLTELHVGLDPSGTDDSPAIAAAMAVAAVEGGGIVEFGAGAYKCLQALRVPDGVALRGIPGRTSLDFRGLDHWENGIESGLILAQGSLGTALALTQSTRRSVPIVFRLLSATRSGTTVTAETDMPHGLSAGDPVWIAGNPSAGQAVFYSVNPAIGLSARTNPFIVASIVDATHFTYAVANTGDTALTGLAFCNFASDVILVASTAGLAAGQDVMIRSAAYRSATSISEQNHLGELAKIARIVNATTILLQADVQDDYATADAAEIVPVALQRGFSVEGIEIVGRGANTDAGYGDRGIVAYLCEAPRVVNCRITAVDQMGVFIWSCLGGSVRDTRIVFDVSDEAGFASGGQDIQYGIAYGGCTTGLTIAFNHVTGGRHAVVQTMTSVPTYHGVARNIAITSNTLRGQYLASIASHQGVDTLVIVGNLIEGGQGGINPRYSRDVVMTANVITAYGYGIYCYNHVGTFTASGNIIRAGQWCIRVGRDVDPASPYGPLKIVGNNCEGGEYGIYVFDETAGTVAIDIDISGNTTRGTKYEGIRVTIGDITSAADGWSGKVNDNTIIDAALLGSRNGVWLANFRFGQANDNLFKGSTALKCAIYLEGAGTGDGLHFWDNLAAPGLLSEQTINATAGYGHRTNMPPIDTASAVVPIVAGVLSPRLAGPMIVVDTEGGAATDDLDTVLTGYIGQIVTLRSASNARVVTLRDNTGNIQLAGSASRVLDNARDTVSLMWSGASWNELAFASN